MRKIFTSIGAVFALFVFALTAVASPVAAFSAASIPSFAKGDNSSSNIPQLYLSFTYEMYFEQVDRPTLFEFMKEIPNDDLWCLCSQTWVINEGSGSKQIGRQWEQLYSFAGLQDHIIYTREFLEEDEQHSWTGRGIFADIGSDYLYEDLPNGGTKLTFNAVYRINFDVPAEQVMFILQALRSSYESQFIPYFGSTGHVELNNVVVMNL